MWVIVCCEGSGGIIDFAVWDFGNGLTDKQMDIGDSRVAFVTENALYLLLVLHFISIKLVKKFFGTNKLIRIGSR